MKIITSQTPEIYQSNSMNRGIQTFTSMLSDDAGFIFLESHLDRLLKGAHFLFPQHKWLEKKQAFEDFLKSEWTPKHYYRLSIIDDTVFFTKKVHAPKEPYVSLGNAKSIKSPSIIPAYVKNANYLMADLEIHEARKRKCDDVVFFDREQNVTEASTANIFVVLNESTILTPKTSSMVLEGVTRGKLIEYLRSAKYNLIESDISKSELESCSEIWLTNAISGIRLVEKYEKFNMFKERTIYQTVCSEFGRFGEKFNHE